MNSESRDEAPTFEKVARLIAEEEGDVDWLAGGLRGWIWPQERYPASARKYGHGLGLFADIVRTRWWRAKLLKALTKTLPSAAETLTDLMADWALFGFLTDERLGPGFDHHERRALANLVHEIRRRCRQQVSFRSLFPRVANQRREETRSWRPGRSMKR
jgi:hypothetical protein